MLSEWSGWIASVRYRCGIPLKELSAASNMSEDYLQRFLRKEGRQWPGSVRKIENGLRSCVEKRGIDFDEVFPPEKRSS